MDQNRDNQIDSILEALLAQYSAVEPRPGLETRILANVREAALDETPPLHWSFKWLWSAIPVLATIIVVTALLQHNPRAISSSPVQQKQAVTQPTVQRAQPEEITVPTARRVAKPIQVHAQHVSLALNQRPPVFPSNAPLSEQERMLLLYVHGTSREELIAQSHPDLPPEILQEQAETIPDLFRILQPSNTR
jgi:hypothetical protein